MKTYDLLGPNIKALARLVFVFVVVFFSSLYLSTRLFSEGQV